MSPERWPQVERTESEAVAAGLTIEIVSGVGFGPTKLAAFDAALREAGIADYNLVYLSSIIPPGAQVIPEGTLGRPAGTWGDRLYVVMAELRVDTRYEEAVAGLGWVQDKGTGQGLFVEHVGHTEREVRRDVLATLDAMCAGRRGRFGAPELVIRNTVCAGEPTCAVVAAVYESAAWDGAADVIDLR